MNLQDAPLSSSRFKVPGSKSRKSAVISPNPKSPHVPVLLNEVLDGLLVPPGGTYIDGTVGAGGHALEIMRRAGDDGQLLGLDVDPDALQIASEHLREYIE